MDLATELLKNGWAKANEKSKREPNEEDLKRKDLENEAKGGMRGMWNPQGPKVSEDILRTRQTFINSVALHCQPYNAT